MYADNRLATSVTRVTKIPNINNIREDIIEFPVSEGFREGMPGQLSSWSV